MLFYICGMQAISKVIPTPVTSVSTSTTILVVKYDQDYYVFNNLISVYVVTIFCAFLFTRSLETNSIEHVFCWYVGFNYARQYIYWYAKGRIA